EKGAFPLYDPSMLDRPNLLGLDDETRALIAAHGLRNGCLTSIAPTGTTSLMAGNISSGVEPVFAYAYTRKVLQPDGSKREEAVEDYALTVWKRLYGDAPPPTDAFVTAQTLTPAQHLRMQAAAQEVIDSSISKTVNCPEDIAFDAFADVYVEGWKLGCKGLTTYRPNAVTGSVLSATPSGPAAAPPAPDVRLIPRPETLAGSTYKIKWPDSPHAVYVTINDVEGPDGPRPFEIFINSKNMEHYAWTVALTRMISAVFRRGGDVAFVVEELKAVFDPRGGQWMGGRYVPSLLAAIGEVIERHMIDIGFLPLAGDGAASAENQAQARLAAGPREHGPHGGSAASGRFRQCPKCGAPTLIRQEDCDTCASCGYSKCS
ncbi:MAG: TSCPD domain-containing protein, partial [Rhodospirillales bacterium]